MEPEPTQQSTQPYWDNRRSGGASRTSNDDVICILHPASPAACKVVENVAKHNPQHILSPDAEPPEIDDLTLENTLPIPQGQGVQVEEFLQPARASTEQSNQSAALAEREIALRTTSEVRKVLLGFVFGRDAVQSDIVLQTDVKGANVSAMHFRIYVTEHGMVMLEDTSTNGTMVDNCVLQKGRAEGAKGTKRMLTHGSVIEVVIKHDSQRRYQEVAKFIVRLPERGNTGEYEKNLLHYIGAVEEARSSRRKDFTELQRHEAPQVNREDEHLFKVPGLRMGLSPPKPHNQNPKPATINPWNITAGTSRFHHSMAWDGGAKYNVISSVGKGAFATVYKLATVAEGIVFAAKELEKRRFMKNGILDQKVNNELEIMKNLTHPHIVQFSDWHDTKDHLYIIMEFVQWGDLSPHTSPINPLPESVCQLLAGQICHALHYLHRQGIVHRDIKPDNILVSSKEPFKVKLSDFGLSKMVGHDNQTFLRTFCGTLLYCAPEVYPDYERIRHGLPRRRKFGESSPKPSPYSSAVDIWSFGAVLYHVLVGDPPFEGSAEHQGARMLEAIMQEDVDYSFLDKQINDTGIDFLRKMLARDASKRATASQLLSHPWIRNSLGIQFDVVHTVAPDHIPLPPVQEVGEAGPAEIMAIDRHKTLYHGSTELVSGRSLFRFENPQPAENETLAEAPHATLARNEAPLTESDSLSHWIAREPQIVTTSGSDDVVLRTTSTSEIGSKMYEDPVRSALSSTNFENSSLGESNEPNDYGSTTEPPGPQILAGQTDPPIKQRRLFGEIIPLAVDESGVFGGAPQPVVTNALRDVGVPGPAGSALGETCSMTLKPPYTGFDGTSAQVSDDFSAMATVKRIRELHDGGEELHPSKRSMSYIGQPLPASEASSVVVRNDAEQRMGNLHLHLGTLTPLPGSISEVPIKIDHRVTNWGRFPQGTHVYPNHMDTRIPRCGIDIVFWSPDMREADKFGADWVELPGVQAMLMTRSSRGLIVNGVHLEMTPPGSPFRCGKLRTGDIIEVFDDGEAFLRYYCEFYVGESAMLRQESLLFQIEENPELYRLATAQAAAKSAQIPIES